MTIGGTVGRFDFGSEQVNAFTLKLEMETGKSGLVHHDQQNKYQADWADWFYGGIG